MYLCSIYLLSPLVERIYFNFEPHSHCLSNLKFYVNARKGHVFDINKSGIPVNPIIVRSVYTMILTQVY